MGGRSMDCPLRITKTILIMKYVTFCGGFHNCGAIRVRVNDEQYKNINEGFYPLDEILSEGQIKRLNRHFCGVKGCTCGGVLRAEIEF